jgi:superfamily II DNA or RNA helicase
MSTLTKGSSKQPQKSKTNKFQEYSREFTQIIESNHKTKLRPHQREALKKTKEFFKDCKDFGAYLVLPTGSGKSGIISFLPYILNSKKTLIVTPSLKITVQLCQDMSSEDSFYKKVELTVDCTEELLNSTKCKDGEEFYQLFPNYNLVIANYHKFQKIKLSEN